VSVEEDTFNHKVDRKKGFKEPAKGRKLFVPFVAMNQGE
jgi:hypothetical protein